MGSADKNEIDQCSNEINKYLNLMNDYKGELG
jgi:hypothetical protein